MATVTAFAAPTSRPPSSATQQAALVALASLPPERRWSVDIGLAMGLTGPQARGNMAQPLNALWRAGYLTRQRGKSPGGGWCMLYGLTRSGEAAVAELRGRK